MAPPLTAGRLLTEWSPEPVTAALCLAAVVMYAAGVRRLRARGRRWAPSRSWAFAAGIACTVVATQSALGRYDTVLFSAHVVQHLLLGMVAPLLLALAAPVTLALQAVSRPTQRALLRLVHSRPLGVATGPAVGAALFAGSLFVLYLTPLFELSLRNGAVHALVHLHFLAAGSVFFWPLLSPDPVRRRLPHPARLLLVFLTVPVHAVLGVAILSAEKLLAGGWYGDVARSWGASALSDQRTAGGLLWATGDLLGVLAVGLVLAQWMRHDEREGAREDRRLYA